MSFTPKGDDLEAELTDRLRTRADSVEPRPDPGPEIDHAVTHLRVRRRRRVTGAILVALAVVAGSAVVVVQRTDRPSSTAVVSAGGPTLPPETRQYRASGQVLAVAGQPLKLCVAGGPETADLRPSDVLGIPRCSFGVPLVGVTLDSAPGVRTVEGQTFSDAVTVVGTWDGTTLAATEPVTPGAAPGNGYLTPTFPLPCAVPPGGWPPLPANVDAYTAAIGALDAYGTTHADTFAGSWSGSNQDMVMVEAFTDDPANHEAALRAIYSRVCVVRGVRTQASLRAAQANLSTAVLPNGSTVLGSGIGMDPDEAAGPMVVSVTLTVDDPDVRAWLHDRFGDAVRVEGGLITAT